MLSTISLVSAADEINEDIVQEGTASKTDISDNVQMDVQVADTDQSSDDNSFTALNKEIMDSGSEINITQDYAYNPEKDSNFTSGIVLFSKNITINGNNHVIDGLDAESIFYIFDSTVRINNLTLKNVKNTTIILMIGTYITDNVTYDGEGGYKAIQSLSGDIYSNNDVYLSNFANFHPAVDTLKSKVNINNATFKNSYDNEWGSICLTDSELNITNTLFNNISSKYASAIYGKNVTGKIENCNFTNLYANLTAGAIALKNIEGNVLIKNCSFVNATSLNNGGALFIDITGSNNYTGTVYLDGCKFIACDSSFGGALLQLGGQLYINDCRFTDNFALYRGGAVYTSDTKGDISNSQFNDNSISLFDGDYDQGGAIYFDLGTLKISNSTFYNSIANEGQSLYINDANYTICDSYFENSIYTRFDKDTAELINNTFADNNNTINNRDYYYVYEGEGMQLEYNPVIIGEGNLTAEYFNLVDYGLVSPVKNQGFNGACWTFATTSPLESALLKATTRKILWDISENNIQNFGLKYSDLGSKEFVEGGTFKTSISYMTSWIGVTTEDYDVYDELCKISPLVENGSKYYVFDTVALPINDNTNISVYKEALIKYGAIGVYVLGASGGSDQWYNEQTASSYVNESLEPDHGVTLVGWNDTYSKENFNIIPPGDGAWIIKNSWGTDWGNNGYYYVSYYDKVFATEENPLAFDLNNSYLFEKNYEYDVSSMPILNFPVKLTGYSSVYTAVGNDLLCAVGTYFEDSGVEYTLKIESEDYSYEQNGKSKHAVYETILLNEYVPLTNGQYFVVTFMKDKAPISMQTRLHVPPKSNILLSDEGDYDLTTEGGVVCIKAYTIIDNSYIVTDNLTTKYGSGEYIKVIYYDENGELLKNSAVEFRLNGKIIERMTDENGMAILDISLPVGTYTVVVINPINDRQCNVSLTILPDGDKPSVNPHKQKYDYRHYQAATKTAHNYVHKILLNNVVIYESNVLNLEALNLIFNQSFINGHLLVYIDGELVFNDTVNDDLSTVILEIIGRFLGKHEIKVVFTDTNNESKTFVENITII